MAECDPRWYELLGPGRDEAWRDPWVFPDPGGDGWHMLVTARSKSGADGPAGRRRARPVGGPGAVAGAAPAQPPDTGFWHLEVPQVEVVAGRPVLIFSCLPGQLSRERRDASGPGAIWCVPGDSVLGPFDTGRAVPLTGEDLYSGRLVRDRAGQWVMLAFRNVEAAASSGRSAIRCR